MTTRHLTLFEMLGNFSFGHAGGYSKREAVHYAWDFLTNHVQLDESRLVVSVLDGDVETEEMWRKELNSSSQIVRMGPEDNFWAMGDSPGTPCGPCSEIYWRQDSGELLEIWNLVFVQERVGGGRLRYSSIDTGMGLERLCSVVENVSSNFEIEAFSPLIRRISELLNLSRDPQNVACRVMADHVRAAVFLIADGVFPSNIGRGHVLRRLIRRALRFAYLNGISEPVMYDLVPLVYLSVGQKDAVAMERAEYISGVILAEEKGFLDLLPIGCDYLNKQIQDLAPGSVLNGESVFKLNDAFGFPMDLTAQICREKGIKVDLKGAKTALESHKKVSRGAKVLSFGNVSHCGQFIGPDNFEIENVKCRVVSDAGNGWISIDPCPFYPQGGGQLGDSGFIKIENMEIPVIDCQSNMQLGAMIKVEDPDHILQISNSFVVANVNLKNRFQTSQHHSATHLIHSILRKIIDSSVSQAGSKVSPDGLRFDFLDPSRHKLSSSDIIEKLTFEMEDLIAKGIKVSTFETTLEEAKHSFGAIGLFGEKYGEIVRVVSCGGGSDETKSEKDNAVSVELCGGTHVENTKLLSPFVVVSLKSIGSGLRRVEAKVGAAAVEYLEKKKLLEAGREKSKKEKKKLSVAQVRFETLKSDDSHLVVHKASEQVDLESVKKKAHQSKIEMPEVGLHVVFGPCGGESDVVVAISAKDDSQYDARAQLESFLRICQNRKGGGGGTAEFASGVGKDCKTLNLDLNMAALEECFHLGRRV